MFVAFAFVPPNLALHYFKVLLYDIPSELEPLYDYFEDYYLGCPARHRQRRAPNFAFEMWSMYQWPEFGFPRTNNAVVCIIEHSNILQVIVIQHFIN